MDKAAENGRNLDCRAIQVFTRNQMQWQARPLRRDEIDRFRSKIAEYCIGAVVSHDSYLINLGSPEDAVLEKSLHAFADEIDRCEQLGIRHLVFHPGSHIGSGESAGLRRITQSLNEVLSQSRSYATQVLVETTAGQGSNLGYRFEQLTEILTGVREKKRIGICVDTCHLFAAGYDLRTRKAYERTFRQLDEVVGLQQVKAFHLNDSKKGLGSRVDRPPTLARVSWVWNRFGFS